MYFIWIRYAKKVHSSSDKYWRKMPTKMYEKILAKESSLQSLLVHLRALVISGNLCRYYITIYLLNICQHRLLLPDYAFIFLKNIPWYEKLNIFHTHPARDCTYISIKKHYNKLLVNTLLLYLQLYITIFTFIA